MSRTRGSSSETKFAKRGKPLASERLNLDRSHAEESHQEANRKAKEPQQNKHELTQDSRRKTAARQRKEEINPN